MKKKNLLAKRKSFFAWLNNFSGKRKFFIFLICLFVAGTFSVYFTKPALSAPIVTITPLSADTNTSVDYCFGWNSQDLDVTTDLIAIVFPRDPDDLSSSFDLSGVTISDTIADTEVYFYIGSSDCSTGGRPGETIPNNQADRDLVYGFNDENAKVAYVFVNVDDDAVIADDTPISIGFVAKAGNTVVTPQTAGNYKVTVVQYLEGSDPVDMDWWDVQLLYIGGLNEVDISGSVDPTLTLNLYDEGTTTPTTVCGLGVLSHNQISTCSYDVSIATNASNGYAVFVREDGPMTNASSDTLDAVADDDISPTATTTEEYGIAIKTTDTLGSDVSGLTQYNSGGKTCTDSAPTGWNGETTADLSAFGLSTSDQEFAIYGGTVNGSTQGLTTLCHAAAVAASTEAGIYTQIVTITAVANF